MLSSKNLTGWFARRFYGRSRARTGGYLPEKLQPTQRAFYYFPDGIPIVSPMGVKLDESKGIGKWASKTVFRCAAYSCKKADAHFQAWAKENLVDGKVKRRRKFLGIFGLLLLAMMMPALAGAQTVGQELNRLDSLIAERDTASVLCFKYHQPTDMSKYEVCDQRGHVEGPGLMLHMEYESAPYVEDTDSTSAMVYPGLTRIDWGCLRCGIIITKTLTDWRRPIWQRRESTDK